MTYLPSFSDFSYVNEMPTQDVVGEVVYKGAFYGAELDEIYYVIVETENDFSYTFYVPSYLWLSLKEGTKWAYRSDKQYPKDFVENPRKGLTDDEEEL